MPAWTGTGDTRRRIFPDRTGPSDPEAHRERLYIRVETLPAVSGLVVFARGFDVDEPVFNGGGNLPDPRDTDDFWYGDDNVIDTGEGGFLPPHPTQPQNIPSGADVTQSGVATILFATRYHAGANYRAACSGSDRYLNLDLTVDPSDEGRGQKFTDPDGGNAAENSPYNAAVSNLLTVWRRLFIERDRMNSVTGNEQMGEMVALSTGAAEGDTMTLELTGGGSLRDGSADLDSSPTGNGRFEGGNVTLGGTSYAITANGQQMVRGATNAYRLGCQLEKSPDSESGIITAIVHADVSSTVTLASSPSQSYVGGTITICGIVFDVTAQNNSTLTTNCVRIACTVNDDDAATTGDLPSMGILSENLDASFEANVFARAYVVPCYSAPWVSGLTSTSTFRANVELSDCEAQIQCGQQTHQNAMSSTTHDSRTESLWIGYLQAGFQGPMALDLDPSTETGEYNGGMGHRDHGALVFLESLRDLAVGRSIDLGMLSARVAAHELGHQLSCADDPNHVYGGIMSSDWANPAVLPINISDVEVRDIRASSGGPGSH